VLIMPVGCIRLMILLLSLVLYDKLRNPHVQTRGFGFRKPEQRIVFPNPGFGHRLQRPVRDLNGPAARRVQTPTHPPLKVIFLRRVVKSSK